MRIDNATVAYHNIVWIACNVAGRIIVANSNEGNIPKFVAEDKERAEQLSEKLCGISAIERQRVPPIDYNLLASKGFYCFANTDPYDGNIYHLCSKPKNPQLVELLDEQTKQFLLLQKLQIDAGSCEWFRIDD